MRTGSSTERMECKRMPCLTHTREREREKKSYKLLFTSTANKHKKKKIFHIVPFCCLQLFLPFFASFVCWKKNVCFFNLFCAFFFFCFGIQYRTRSIFLGSFVSCCFFPHFSTHAYITPISKVR